MGLILDIIAFDEPERAMMKVLGEGEGVGMDRTVIYSTQ